jgi:hypothetical protein
MKRAGWLIAMTGGILVLGSSAVVLRAGDDKGTVVEIDGLKSPVPASWVAEKPTSKLRVAQFRVPRAKEDPQDAELVIFYFEGQGGGVEDNVKRWKAMFFPPRGKTIDDVSTIEKMKAGDVPVTVLDVHGTYKYKKAPIVPDNQAELRPNYRMLAAYFGSKNGPYFIRLVGPAATVEQNKKGFDAWLKNFK